MSGRFSSVVEFSPTGTVVGAATVYSNAVKTEAASDARVFLHVATAPGGAATLDVDVEVSHDLVRWASAGAFNTVVAAGNHAMPLKREQLGVYARLKYVGSGPGDFILGAVLEKKQGG